MAPPAILEYADWKNGSVVTKVVNVTTECNTKESSPEGEEKGGSFLLNSSRLRLGSCLSYRLGLGGFQQTYPC
jgi:hypothetical protein